MAPLALPPHVNMGLTCGVRAVPTMLKRGVRTTLLRAVPTHQVLLGAAGDLARKKTFPSLFKLYLGRYLPQCAHAPPNQCPLAPFRSAVATPAQQTPLLLAGNLRPPARFVFDLPPVSR